MEPIYIFLIILAVIILWGVFIFNRLVALRNRVQEAWSDIDVQLKRRYNLIPNLVSAVKGYATHERGVFEEVTKARSNAMNAQSIKEQAGAENMLSNTLKSLFAVSENYPDLKASANFIELQRELRDAEDKIQAARRFYNTNVRDFNIKIESFPPNLIAGICKFEKREFFEIEEPAARETPKVEF